VKAARSRVRTAGNRLVRSSGSSYRQALQDAGFIVLSERNRHQFAMDSTSQPVTTHVLIGATAGEKLANARASLIAGLIAPVEIIGRAH
jgi:hypothetical protein